MKKISVVIPCFNASEYLEYCMSQLLQQTMKQDEIEIILVDDASTDDGATWNCILEYEKKFSDMVVAVRLEENMRQGGARNVGISYATGEYLLFCDADDWLAVEALEHLYVAAKTYEADVVEFRKKVVREAALSESKIEYGENNRFFTNDTVKEKKAHLVSDAESFRFGCVTKLYRLPMVKEHHIAFAEHVICEEPSFTLPVLLYEKKHYFLDETLYFYHMHQDSTVTGNWDGHKWDNEKTWLHLMQDLADRELFGQYYEELEYLFTCWYMGLSLKLWCKKGYFVQKEELFALRDTVLKLFPNVLQNRYFEKKQNPYENFLLQLFRIVLSDESIAVVNQMLQNAFLK